jgi:SAM-dependent methyltransferase
MKSTFLDSIRCIDCAHSEYTTDIHESNSFEWYTGKLTCKQCGRTYLIRQGVLDTLSHLDQHLEKEYGAFLEHYGSKPVSKLSVEDKDRFILDLPHSTDDPSIAICFDETIQYIESVSGQRVLDLGSGVSWTTREFARNGAQAVALDLIDHQLFASETFFRDTPQSYFERVRSDMECLPFRDASFDMVFARASVHHSQNLVLLFREIARVLAPGGRFFLTQEPIFGLFQRKSLKQFGATQRDMGSTENCYTTLEWKTSAGLASLDVRFVFLNQGLPEKFCRFRLQDRYTGIMWKTIARILEIPSLLKLFRICYISPLHYLFPVNLLIVGKKENSAA